MPAFVSPISILGDSFTNRRGRGWVPVGRGFDRPKRAEETI